MTEEDSVAECKFGCRMGNDFCQYKGKDNFGELRAVYIFKLMAMSDEELYAEMKSKIWLSAYAANNSRSDYHWHCDATYQEGERRGKPGLYSRAYAET
jgi:hypothetical protein